MYFYNYQWCFAVVGILFILRIILFLFSRIFEIFSFTIWYRFFPKDVVKYGKYAVITGATDGIGKAMGLQLAKRGMNIVLISRNMEKLKSTAREFKEENVDVRIIQQDFTSEISISLKEKLKTIDVGILVNNVGGGFDPPYNFLEMSDRYLVKLVYLNIGSVLMMSHIVLPGMLSKHKGAILNISSISCLRPYPFLLQYGAFKSFMRSLSLGLDYEYRNLGITFHCLMPSSVYTKALKKIVHCSNGIFPSAETYASSAVNVIGTVNQTTGYWLHEVERIIVELTPIWIFNKISVFVLKKIVSRNS